jgi:dUTPase
MHHPKAQPPIKSSELAAGWDLAVAEGGIVWPGRSRRFSTGLQFFLEPWQSLTMSNRSGVFVHGLIVNNSPCDPDYRWQKDSKTFEIVPSIWNVVVRNIGLLPYRVRVGDRLGQVLLPYGWYFIEAEAVLSEAEIYSRMEWFATLRSGGFGSTGR